LPEVGEEAADRCEKVKEGEPDSEEKKKVAMGAMDIVFIPGVGECWQSLICLA
jgi:hypothetical protein